MFTPISTTEFGSLALDCALIGGYAARRTAAGAGIDACGENGKTRRVFLEKTPAQLDETGNPAVFSGKRNRIGAGRIAIPGPSVSEPPETARLPDFLNCQLALEQVSEPPETARLPDRRRIKVRFRAVSEPPETARLPDWLNSGACKNFPRRESQAPGSRAAKLSRLPESSLGRNLTSRINELDEHCGRGFI